MNIKSRVLGIVGAILLAFVVGILGYEVIEGWNFLDSTYMTVITLATIGYGETHTLSDAGRIFTMFLILIGFGAVSYGAVSLTEMIAEGDLLTALRRRQMDKAISRLKNHYIVCGAGKTGLPIIYELVRVGRSVVVVDKDPSNIRRLQSADAMYAHFGKKIDLSHLLFIEGDAATDEVLIEAGIERADGIFCALSNDKDNLFVVLSARGLNTKIRIVSKCEDEESDQKFTRAGADTIVSPNRIGGLRMASVMIRPTVTTFLDVMLRDSRGYRFEEVEVREGSSLVGQALGTSRLGTDPEIQVVAISGEDGAFHYNPSKDTLIRAGTRFVLLGNSEYLHQLQARLNVA